MTAMRRSALVRRQYRPYYNLPSTSTEGRRMTGFLTPYRHWMWKQNELWRNVHEAQFEHLRRVYKRQWLESFRVNADEYIYKYNITKAAQLAQWEYEMQAQEKKRREAQQLAHGRQALKKKHLDLLREYHERQFFYWYERASERLQYMSRMRYVKQADVMAHIERELDKYVAGAAHAYPLNFAGQLPLLEDREGNIVQVPHNLIVNHVAEQRETRASAYTPPASTAAAEAQLLQMMASAQEEELQVQLDENDQDMGDGAAAASRRRRGRGGGGGSGGAAAAAPSAASGDDVHTARVLTETIDTLAQQEAERDDTTPVARSMEETEEQRAISRRAYIDRGKTGSRAIFRRTRPSDGSSSSSTPATSSAAGTTFADTTAGSDEADVAATAAAVDEDVDVGDGDGAVAQRGGAHDDVTPLRHRKSHTDRVHAMQARQDALEQQHVPSYMRDAKESATATAAAAARVADTKRGEVRERRGTLRDIARQVATTEKLMERPEVQELMRPDARVHMRSLLEQRFGRGKQKAGEASDTDGGGSSGGGGNTPSKGGGGGKTRR